MANSLILTKKSKPVDALELPKGRLALGIFSVNPTPEDVVECATLVIENGGREEAFVSQAGVVAHAGNELGWGAKGGYKTG